MEVLRQGWTIREVFHPQFLVLRDARGPAPAAAALGRGRRRAGHAARVLDAPGAAAAGAARARRTWPAADLGRGVHEVLDLVGRGGGRLARDGRSGRSRSSAELAAQVGDGRRRRRRGRGRPGARAARLAERQPLHVLRRPRLRPVGQRRRRPVRARSRAPGSASSRGDEDPAGRVLRPARGCDGAPGAARRDQGRTPGPGCTGPPTSTTSASAASTRDGAVVGEHRLLGLFSTTAYSESVMRVPVLRQKAEAVIEGSGYDPASHGGKAIVDTLETYPRDELFQTPLPELAETVERIAHLKERRQVRIFVRADPYGRFVSCLVYLPRDRYTGTVRRKMEQVLLDRLGGASIDDSARVTDAVLARLHVVVRMPAGQSARRRSSEGIDLRGAGARAHRGHADLGRRVRRPARRHPGRRPAGRRCCARCPRATRRTTRRAQGRQDLAALADLESGADMALALYVPDPLPGRPVDEADLRLKIFRRDVSLSLSQLLPHLTRLGVDVIDERPYELDAGDDGAGLDLRLRAGACRVGRAAVAADWDAAGRERFVAAFRAAYEGEAESDAFCALVMAAGLGWREVSVLRSVGHYLRQGGVSYSQTYMAQALAANTAIARQLFDLFAVRFDPSSALSLEERAGARATEIGAAVENALDDVSSLDQDKIIRSFLAVLRALVRTNFYRPGPAGAGAQAAVARGARPARAAAGVRDLRALAARRGRAPALRPRRPRRAALVRPRGGLPHRGPRPGQGADGQEHGDRPDRGEGRLRAAPAARPGARPRRVAGRGRRLLPDLRHQPARRDRQPGRLAARSCRRRTSCATTATTRTSWSPPTRARRRSPTSRTRSRWRRASGSATRSPPGGSVGYDHKAMGITARGAWESVVRHFRELGIDPGADDFTCVGIGDMSGDVFGNGMLLSEHLRLVAAFDHRHVFLDPDPDPARSFAERRRLFALPRSSWADYDPALISEGGGVYPRTLKSVPVTEPVRRALGLADGVTSLDPTALISAALKAPGRPAVERRHRHLRQGRDRVERRRRRQGQRRAARRRRAAPGPLRGGGRQPRADPARAHRVRDLRRQDQHRLHRQLGRAWTPPTTRSTSRSCWPPTSRTARSTPEGRNALLASMTDDVAGLVLAHNVSQNLALANAEAQAAVDGPRARGVDRPARGARAHRPGDRVPARRGGARRPAGQEPRPHLARAGGAARLHQDRPERRGRAQRPARRPATWPTGSSTTSRRPCAARTPSRCGGTGCTARSSRRSW